MSENRGRRGGKSNAERKAEHDARQRALGRRQRNYWLTDEEAQEVARLIEQLRKGDQGEME
ncbi:hypothetical protein [Vreelandella alkaliphila]|uniref:hypothetical protein n=1 Tax=Vreelandella alkaliphila TaxID=272774 RepID=UPI003FD7CB5E